MAKSKHVTYIIGAGASYYAIPTINEFDLRLQYYLRDLQSQIKRPKNQIRKGGFYFTYYNELNGLLEIFNKHLTEILKHETPDTYAKKLFLMSKDDELFEFKALLSCFFEYEQSESKSGASITAYLRGRKYAQEKLKNLIKLFQNQLDHRYDSFYARIIKNRSKIFLPRNINIISWNYDSQFEMAFKDYLIDVPDYLVPLRLNTYPNTGNKEPLKDRGAHLKLNGSASLLYNGDGIESSELRENESQPRLNAHQSCLRYYSEALSMVSEDRLSPSLSFAWEGGDVQGNTWRYAAELIKTTDIIVVIGYSFPDFNRDVDIAIIQDCPTKEVYIQVPSEEDYQNIRERITTINPSFEPKHIKQTDQFYIPLTL